MTTIFTQVRGDAIRARVLAHGRRGDGIRYGSPTCLTQCGDVIDVDVEALVRMGSGCWHSFGSLASHS